MVWQAMADSHDIATIALAAILFAGALAFWAWQTHLERQVRRLQARHRALTERQPR